MYQERVDVMEADMIMKKKDIDRRINKVSMKMDKTMPALLENFRAECAETVNESQRLQKMVERSQEFVIRLS